MLLVVAVAAFTVPAGWGPSGVKPRYSMATSSRCSLINAPSVAVFPRLVSEAERIGPGHARLAAARVAADLMHPWAEIGRAVDHNRPDYRQHHDRQHQHHDPVDHAFLPGAPQWFCAKHSSSARGPAVHNAAAKARTADERRPRPRNGSLFGAKIFQTLCAGATTEACACSM
jgi:hypothetical protein